MNESTARLGFWSSMTGLFCFVVYVIAFIGIAVSNQAFTWTDTDAFILYSYCTGAVICTLRAIMVE